MKLNNRFIVHQTGNDTVIVPTAAAGFSGVVRGNRTLGDIASLLRRDVTQADILAALKARYDAPDGVIERDVQSALDQLRRIGAIEE